MFKRYRMRLLIGLGFASLTAVPLYAKTVPPATTFKDCDYCSEMVVLPAGEYMMGANREDFEGDEKEYQFDLTVMGPPRSVKVRSFAIGRYHVTRKQFAVFANETGFEGKGCRTFNRTDWAFVRDADWKHPGFPQTEDDPVVCVSWDDTQKYIAWLNTKLSGKIKHSYRLPTNEEWEYAARAGTTTSRYWGSGRKEQCLYENTRDETAKALDPDSPVAPCNDNYLWTSPVGSFRPNPWGLYDMLGDASQWLSGCSENSNALTAALPRVPEDQCRSHSIRGASWATIPQGVRAASWGGGSRGIRNSAIGFRLATGF
ncbi:SUMF1/EgtB/PvdO family nonheme iron enzyme [Caballeronia sp. NK8]|uniref:formylglycine-generating enzyme family protein n=1 Tax=Caballeronia sp. NK8 TaxID=140098 RepID=UPI001BB65124|nr:formylglycine-generating enzyme family protein [Caballeronia sp. NK8]BCQ25905.1 SUMF1/EgtB/PvdO family nonheme iron enzyme [Caballeronia sp. NK8]